MKSGFSEPRQPPRSGSALSSRRSASAPWAGAGGWTDGDLVPVRGQDPLPALLITDLGLAGVGGMEVLRVTRETPGLARTPDRRDERVHRGG